MQPLLKETHMSVSIHTDTNTVNPKINQASGFSHSFDVGYAMSYGVNEALMIQTLKFFITTNANRGQNFHEGRFWTYDRLKDFNKHFPYWSFQTVRTTLNSLIKQEVIIKGEFNKSWSDRTQWYAFKDQHLFIGNIDPPKIVISLENTSEIPEMLKSTSERCENQHLTNVGIDNCIYDTSTITTAITNTNTSLKVSEKPNAAKAADVRIEFSSEIKELSKRMVTMLNEANPHWLIPKNLYHFMSQIHGMHEEEGRKLQDIFDIFQWTVNDHFWMNKLCKPNPAKYLRTQFGQLAANMNAKIPQKPRKFAPSSDDAKALKKMEESMANAI